MTEIDDLTIDTTAAEQAINRVIALTDNANQELDETEEKTQKVSNSLKLLDQQAERSLRTALSVARRGVLLMNLFITGTKNAVTKSLVIMSQAALIAAETAITIATASSFTVIGAIDAALGIAAAASLLLQAQQVARFGLQAEQQFDDLDRAIQAGLIVTAGW